MNAKKTLEKQLRGWLPEDPHPPFGSKLKGARPIAVAVAATLLIGHRGSRCRACDRKKK